jgi:hypothetical protein
MAFPKLLAIYAYLNDLSVYSTLNFFFFFKVARRAATRTGTRKCLLQTHNRRGRKLIKLSAGAHSWSSSSSNSSHEALIQYWVYTDYDQKETRVTSVRWRIKRSGGSNYVLFNSFGYYYISVLL